jgi:hypothetical protein
LRPVVCRCRCGAGAGTVRFQIDAKVVLDAKTSEWEMDTVVRLAFADDNHEPIAVEFRKARLRTPDNFAQFKAQTLSRGADGWASDAMSGKPMDGRRSAEVIKLKHAIEDAYSRLIDGAPLTTGFAGQQVRKVGVAKLREGDQAAGCRNAFMSASLGAECVRRHLRLAFGAQGLRA